MRTVRGIMLEQARQSRERASFYRKLAETLGGSRSAFEVAKCARDLEQRAREIEEFALRPRPLGQDEKLDASKHEAADAGDADPGSIGDIRRTLELAFPSPSRSC
jgi:hypothetical protein